VKISKRKENMARNLLGPIPDDHFENEPTYPAKNVSPLSRYWIERILAVWKPKKQDSDKYKPGDVVGGY
jgi:hypothetical protein